MKVLVVGGSGGIGAALVEHLVNHYSNVGIFSTYRHTQPKLLSDNLHWYQVDVTVEAEIAALAREIPSVDWIINTVGILHTQNHGPEKKLASVDCNFFIECITNNTLPTLLIAKHFAPVLKKSRSPKFAALSAKVGSISDNRLGGWYSYRASKAALNMLIKTISIEWSRTIPNSCVLALHPGTTDTALSKPFQANVPLGKLFSPQKVASELLNIIKNATPEDNGKFLAYDGKELPW